jgi:LPS export ABC transporter protein LptC
VPELVYRIFNRNVIRLIAALAIPLLLYSFWRYANEKATTLVEKTKVDISNRPNQDKITVEDYQLKEVNDSNDLKWLLQAKTGVVDPATKDVNLTTVHVDYFDQGKIKMRLTAPTGVANENTKMTKLLSSKTKRVECEGEDGKAKLLAYQVELKNKNQFLATGGVNIVWPGVAKVVGNQAEGLLKSTDLKNFKIEGNTHAWIGGNQ